MDFKMGRFDCQNGLKTMLGADLQSSSGKKVVPDLFLHVESIAGEEKSLKRLENGQNLIF